MTNSPERVAVLATIRICHGKRRRALKPLRLRVSRTGAVTTVATESIALHHGPAMAISLEPHVVDVLLPGLIGHDKRPSSFVLYLSLYAVTKGVGRKGAFFSYQMLTDRTGLSKRAVQRAVAHLQRRQLVRVARKSLTAVPEYAVATPWVRS